MFFQIDLLKRGGKFHFCWLADSWPERFSTITQRQLSSVDITELCEELLDMIQRESRSPYNRFSLRLSCQLVHGITRLYRRKANACLSDICILNAKILRQKRLKDTPKEPSVRQGTRGNTDAVQFSHPEIEQQVEERIENSGNAVARFEDITLREVEMPPNVVINDGFGEENEQTINSLLQGLTESMEMMVGRSEYSLLGQISGGDLSGLQDSRDFRAERDPIGTRARMEGIVEDSFLMLNLPDPELHQQVPDYTQKDIPEIPEIHPEIQETHPDISEIQKPVQEIPAPTIVVTEIPALENETMAALPPQAPAHSTPAPPAAPRTRSKRRQTQLTEQSKVGIQLEMVEARLPARRRPKKLKIDKTILIDSAQMRARIAQIHIEARCENVEEDHADVILPTEVFFKRPSCVGMKLNFYINRQFVTNFQRCCMVGPKAAREEREMEQQRGAPEVSSMNISTEPTNIISKTPDPRPPATPFYTRPTMEGRELPLIEEEEEKESSAEGANTRSLLDLADLPSVDVLKDTVERRTAMDISDLPTQVIPDDNEGSGRKRTAVDVGENEIPRKVRHVSRSSMRVRMTYGEPGVLIHNVPLAPSVANVVQQEEPQSTIPTEDVPAECVHEQNPMQLEQTKSPPKSITSLEQSTVKDLLHSAGLADRRSRVDESVNTQQRRRSQDSETPLGSLDRTAVSLGDSPKSTASQRYIKETWGTEMTMCRIVVALSRGVRPLTVKKLLDMEPLCPGTRRTMVAASCFSAILKLKQFGFLKVIKDSVTLEILDMEMGPKIVNKE